MILKDFLSENFASAAECVIDSKPISSPLQPLFRNTVISSSSMPTEDVTVKAMFIEDPAIKEAEEAAADEAEEEEAEDEEEDPDESDETDEDEAEDTEEEQD